MKIKGKIFLDIIIISIIFNYIGSLNAISNINNDNNKIKYTNYPIIHTLQRTFPKLSNEKLLEKVLIKILEEFDKPYYNLPKNQNLEEKIKLLERYNLINEFQNTIAQTIFDINEYVFVFVGNRIDFENYNIYLKYKEKNFQDSKGIFWKTWSPSNIEFVSKKYIEFLVDTFEEIMILKDNKQINSQKQKNTDEIENQILVLQQKINSYDVLFKQQEQKIRQQEKQIIYLTKFIDDKDTIIFRLRKQIQTYRKSIKDLDEELSNNNLLNQEERKIFELQKAYFNRLIEQNKESLAIQENIINENQIRIQNLIIELKENNRIILEIQTLRSEEREEFQRNTQKQIDRLNDLQQKLISSQNIIDQLSVTIEENRQLFQKKDEKIKKLSMDITNNINEIKSLNNNIEQLNKELNEKKDEIANNKMLTDSTIQKLNREIEQLIKDKQDLIQQFHFQELILSSNQEQIQNLIIDLQDKNKEIIDIKQFNKKDREELQNVIDKQIEILSQMQNDLNVAENQIESFKQTIQEQQNIIKQQQNQISTLETDIRIKEEVIISLSDQIEQVDKLLQETKKELLDNKSLSEQEIKTLRDNIFQNEKFIKDLKTQLYSKEKFLIQSKEEIKNLRNKSEKQEEEIIKIKTLSEAEINILKQNIKENREHLSKLENDLEISQQTIDQFRQTIEEQNIIIDRSEQRIRNLEKDIDEKNNEIDILTKTIDQKEKELNQKTEELLQNQLLSEQQKNALNEEIAKIKSETKDLKEQVLLKENFITETLQQLSNLESNFAKQRKQMIRNKILQEDEKEELNNEIRRQISRLDRLKNKLERSKDRIENFVQNTQMYNSLISSAMSYVGHLHKETLEFFTRMEKNQESKTNNEMNNVKTFARKTDKLHDFSDVIGNTLVKEQLKETVEQLKNLSLYKSMGSQKTPKGILLYGPPGTGKTYLAEAFAKEAGLPFFAVTSSDFSKTYVGEGPRLIKNLFDEARKHSPSVILIDECEVAFQKRHSDGLNSDHGNIITAFLSQIEGIYSDPEKPVFVIATTNFKDDIDNSILSRFNKLIEVDFWGEKDIVLFLKIISKKYNLDIRAYKYLEKISKKIINSGLNELRTPRKLREIFEQATATAISKHKHLNILPIDLQLIMDRLTNKKNIINWDDHEHIKHDLNELLDIKEYKNTPIKHLFVDSFFTDEEKKYFQFIQKGYSQNNKLVYNKDATTEAIEVDIDSNQLDKIKMFYSSENPLPDKLMGFYFIQKPDSPPMEVVKNISTLEELLTKAIKNKIKKIYFIWDIEKIKNNKIQIDGLMNKYKNKFRFLTLDNVLIEQLLEISQNNENNEKLFEQKILEYIDKIKNQLVDDIYNVITINSNFNISEDSFKLIEQIEQKVKETLEQNNHFSLVEIKQEIILFMRYKLKQEKNMSLQEQIIYLTDKINFNKKIFSYDEIKQIRTQINDIVYDYFIQESNYSLKDIKDQINKIKDNCTQIIFNDKWASILKNLNINFNLYKDKIIDILKQKTQKELFYQDLELDEIMKILDEESQKQIQNIENNLNKKILDDINRYVIVDKEFSEKNISNQEIELIQKGAALIVQDELKKENISEEQIYEKIKFFIKNYKTKQMNFDNSLSDVFSFIQQNFSWLKFVLIIIFCKYFFRKKS